MYNKIDGKIVEYWHIVQSILFIRGQISQFCVDFSVRSVFQKPGIKFGNFFLKSRKCSQYFRKNLDKCVHFPIFKIEIVNTQNIFHIVCE